MGCRKGQEQRRALYLLWVEGWGLGEIKCEWDLQDEKLPR